MSAEPFTDAQMDVIRWAAKECRRQRSSEVSVYWMLNAWNWAMERRLESPFPTEKDILELARLVEPYVNARGYRRVGVRVGSDVKGPAEHVPRQVEALVGAVDAMAAREWFYHYEDIHPFRDGNGRSGSILYNWLNGTLDRPEEPPEFWGEREAVSL